MKRKPFKNKLCLVSVPETQVFEDWTGLDGPRQRNCQRHSKHRGPHRSWSRAWSEGDSTSIAFEVHGIVSKRIREAVISRDGLVCQLCMQTLRHAEVTMDHIVPVSKGGETHIENLRVTCQPCNNTRGNGAPPSLPKRRRGKSRGKRSKIA